MFLQRRPRPPLLFPLAEYLIGRGQSFVDILSGMSSRNKPGLECGWGEIDALAQHGMEEVVEGFFITFHHFCITGRRACSEVETEHPPH